MFLVFQNGDQNFPVKLLVTWLMNKLDKNKAGGFECQCDSGYRGDGFVCVKQKDAVEVCKNTPLPDYVGIVNHRPRTTSRGIVYRVKCENGLNMVPTNPGKIDRLR